jgi:hypothetical protein
MSFVERVESRSRRVCEILELGPTIQQYIIVSLEFHPHFMLRNKLV